LSQTLILIFGYSPLNASLSLLPMTVVMVLIAPQIPELVRKFGPRTAIAGGMVVSAAGMVALSTLDADSGYWHLLGGLAVTALGMSVAMAPATDVLMANVPRERAGMGSATNDVTREVGASLGVAVLGSVLGSSYAAQLTGSVAALPDQAQQLAKQSLAGGLQVATSLGQHGLQLVHDVRAAWMHGLQVAHRVGGGAQPAGRARGLGLVAPLHRGPRTRPPEFALIPPRVLPTRDRGRTHGRVAELAGAATTHRPRRPWPGQSGPVGQDRPDESPDRRRRARGPVDMPVLRGRLRPADL